MFSYDPFDNLLFCFPFLQCCFAQMSGRRAGIESRACNQSPPDDHHVQPRSAGSSRRSRTPGITPSTRATSTAWSWCCHPVRGCLGQRRHHHPQSAAGRPDQRRGQDPAHLDQRVITVRMLGDTAVANGTYVLHHKARTGPVDEKGVFTHVFEQRAAAGCASTRSAPCCAKTRPRQEARSSRRRTCPSTFRCSQRATKRSSTRASSSQRLYFFRTPLQFVVRQSDRPCARRCPSWSWRPPSHSRWPLQSPRPWP